MGEIDNTLLKNEYFLKMYLWYVIFYLNLRSISSIFILYDVIRNICVVSLHFENRRSYCYYKQYCIQKAIHEIDDALLKDKKLQ